LARATTAPRARRRSRRARWTSPPWIACAFRRAANPMPHRPPPHDAREAAFLDKAASAIRVVRFTRRTHPNTAASRAYYAVHHAMNGRFGPGFPVEHGQIVHPVVLARLGLDPRIDAAIVLDLYRARRVADYDSRSVTT